MYSGILHKMHTKLDGMVEYTLKLDEEVIDMNMLIGANIKLNYLNEIHCVECGAITKTSFAQGYCYNCFTTSPHTEDCVLKPEMCRAHEGIARDMAWAEEHCLQEHYVYLALSSDVKVGVTRSTQIPTRWIDQGASSAIKLAKTPNRYTAGLIEVELKKYFSDKTSWQKMLKNEIITENLIEHKNKAIGLLTGDLQKYTALEQEILQIEYPVLDFPTKVNSINFDKYDHFEGKLVGIKGQYLILDDGSVFNVRRHTGYKVSLQID